MLCKRKLVPIGKVNSDSGSRGPREQPVPSHGTPDTFAVLNPGVLDRFLIKITKTGAPPTSSAANKYTGLSCPSHESSFSPG